MRLLDALDAPSYSRRCHDGPKSSFSRNLLLSTSSFLNYKIEYHFRGVPSIISFRIFV